MAYLEELLPEFRNGAKIRRKTWNKNEFIYTKKCTLFNEENLELDGTEMDIWDTFIANDWELYHDPKPDWQYIIDHKCLCWFWNDLGKLKHLKYLQAKEGYAFRDELGTCWENCCPVRRDEVTFYEDKN